MEVTRDVIVDLLPLYLADEASQESRALVEAHLERDPDLARLAQQWRSRMTAPAPAPRRPDAQALAYLQAKRQIQTRTIMLAGVFTAGVLGLAALGAVISFFLF